MLIIILSDENKDLVRIYQIKSVYMKYVGNRLNRIISTQLDI